MPTTTILGQRGRAGGEGRCALPAGTTAGPASAREMVGLFTIAIRWPKDRAGRLKRSVEVVEHIEASGLVLVEQQLGYGQVIVVLAAWPLVTVATAQRIAATCPWRQPDSFKVLP